MIYFDEIVDDVKAFDVDSDVFINYHQWIKSHNVKIIYRHCVRNLLFIYYKRIDN